MGNQGFQGEATSPRFSLLHAWKGMKLLSLSLSNQQVSDNENVVHRQTEKGCRYNTQRNLANTCHINLYILTFSCI